MSMTIPAKTYEACVKEKILHARFNRFDRSDDLVILEDDIVTDEFLAKLSAVATQTKDTRTARAVEGMIDARKGDFSKPVPNFGAAVEIMRLFLESKARRGWVYRLHGAGRSTPLLVRSIRYVQSSNNRSSSDTFIEISFAYHGWYQPDGFRSDGKVATRNVTTRLHPNDVSRRHCAVILQGLNLAVETEELEREYDTTAQRFIDTIDGRYGEQFRFSGQTLNISDSLRADKVDERNAAKVILDQKAFWSEAGVPTAEVNLFSTLFPDGTAATPIHPICRLFDLSVHDFVYAHADDVAPYEYDKTLSGKLVLPETHRELLDVLTTDIDLFTDDLIEGKRANNIVLCRGVPGVGKTLTAEIYAEIMKRPLYPIHSGALGTRSDEIRENLKVIIARAQAWNCVILLDEADVFVLERGRDIEQNAIVAEFLRVLEYFTALMFMTTNRSDLIDDAILSRCLAIIDYSVPADDLAVQAWRTMTRLFGIDFDDVVLRDLSRTFAGASARDMKLLTRLSLRWANRRKEPIDIDHFRRAAPFRGMTIAKI